MPRQPVTAAAAMRLCDKRATHFPPPGVACGLFTFCNYEKTHTDIAGPWLGRRAVWPSRMGEREKAGILFNELVRTGKVKAPIVIGRDHLDTGSVASPNRETEGMMDGSDAVADWPLLNALANTASGATWVSIHQGGGVGMGLAIHAGQVICVDGSPEMEERVKRVLTTDPATGLFRHADAGYEQAIENAKKWDVDIPMMK